jgi:diaminopimelate decarboxylase
MNSPFVRRDGRLFAEDVALADVAAAAGTPVYVYSATALVQRWEALHRSFAQVPHRICYSLKANMNLAVVRTLVARGAGADVTSGGELFRALRAGTPPAHIVYSGVGKTEPEIDRALEVGIELFNAESRAELRRIDAVAGRRGARAPIAFRVNPEVDPHTHPYVATGLRTSKFGVPIAEALEAYAEAKALGHVEVVGVHCHIGSQLTRIGPFADALARIRTLVLDLRETGHDIRILDVGGGLGVRYEHEDPPSAEAYAEAVLDAVGDLGCELVLEPGRWLTAEAGVLLTRVLYTKSNEAKHFAIVDAGMNDLLRPALYGGHHHVEPVGPPRGSEQQVDLVGPVCESGDFLAKDRSLPVLEAGDLLAVHAAGAYGFAMASNYNGRLRAAEVLVRDRRFAVVRERETLEDLVRGESIPKELTE